MTNINPLVGEQYNKWVYPEPIADLEAWTAKYGLLCDPSLHSAIIWPGGAPSKPISILVTGCGTSQAAVLAYTNREARVTGIDISAPSLAHAEKLKAKHKLTNLELREMDLHDAPALGMFDLIYATGVLHHLPDAKTGLTALAKAAKENGVLCVMLYAKYARAGITMMQEALIRLGAGQNAAGIELVRDMAASLPVWHPAYSYIRGAHRDLSFDAGIVDTFLHKEAHTFSVPEILDLAKDCDLVFQGWTDDFGYNPDKHFAKAHPLYQKIAALPKEEQWAVMELLAPVSAFHSFLLRKDS